VCWLNDSTKCTVRRWRWFITCSTNGLQRRCLLVPYQHQRKWRSVRRRGQFGSLYNRILSPRWLVRSYINIENVSITLMAVMKLWSEVVIRKSQQMTWPGREYKSDNLTQKVSKYATDLQNSSYSDQKPNHCHRGSSTHRSPCK